MKRGDLEHIDPNLRRDFADSLALDAALVATYPQENRWDYLLGYGPRACVVGLEPHSAKSDEVSTVIRKKERAREQLRSHLRQGQRVMAWYWVASGRNDFLNTEKIRIRLDQAGIQFVAPRLLAKHLRMP